MTNTQIHIVIPAQWAIGTLADPASFAIACQTMLITAVAAIGKRAAGQPFTVQRVVMGMKIDTYMDAITAEIDATATIDP